MKQYTALLSASALALAVALTVFAAEPPSEEYVEWMRFAGGNAGKIKKAVEGGETETAISTSKDLALNFKHVELFWREKAVEDGQEWSANVQSKALEVAAKAEAGDAEGAVAAHGQMMSNCRGCHAAHREKNEDGEWMIK